jgi:hypothetical protein
LLSRELLGTSCSCLLQEVTTLLLLLPLPELLLLCLEWLLALILLLFRLTLLRFQLLACLVGLLRNTVTGGGSHTLLLGAVLLQLQPLLRQVIVSCCADT